MSIEKNKELVRRYLSPPPPDVILEMKQAKDPVSVRQLGYRSVAEQFFHENCVLHMDGIDRDREGVIEYNLALIAAFPDAYFGLDKMVAEGDTVVIVGRMRGTHQGMYQGVPATGKKVDMGYMVMYRIADDKFIEAWGYMDRMGLLQQLGAIPA